MTSKHLLAVSLPLLLTLGACGDDDSSGDGSTGADASSNTSNAATSAGQTSAAPSTSSTGNGAEAGPETGNAAETGTPTTGDSSETTAGADDDTGADTTGNPAAPPPPTNAADLLPWLEAGNYLEWPAEAEIHPSAGPHLTDVRTFVNDALLMSLEADAAEHPVGAATVKELYNAGSTEIGGWAVMVKVGAGAGDDTWYWYEILGTNVVADDTGVGLCSGCHSAGPDFIRTELPL